MNPGNIMKIMAARSRFEANHPKFFAFCKAVFAQGVEAGTVLELKVTKPGQEPVTTNIKVQPDDLELLNELMNMAGSK